MSSLGVANCFWLYTVEGKTVVHGRCADWRDGLLKTYGHIDQSMRVKNAGTDANEVRNHRYLIDDPGGWFTPFIPDSELGITFCKDGAYGPQEISIVMRDYGREIMSSDEPDAIYAKAARFFGCLPVGVAQKFSQLLEARKLCLQTH